MQALKRTRQNNKGFTLPELMVTVLIMGLVTVVVGSAVTVAMRVYREITRVSNADILCQTAVTAVEDALVYASGDDTEIATMATQSAAGQPIVYFDESEGAYFYLTSDEVLASPTDSKGNATSGNIYLVVSGTSPAVSYPLINQRMLTQNMTVELENLTFDGQAFSGTVTVYGDSASDGSTTALTSSDFYVRPVNI